EHFQRADGYQRQEDWEAAKKSLHEALRVSPSFTGARLALGDLHRTQGDTRAAETEYLRAMALDQNDGAVHLRLAELYLQMVERAAEAVLLLERTLRIEPAWSAPLCLRPRAYQQSGDLPRALGAVNRYLSMVPAPSRDALVEET